MTHSASLKSDICSINQIENYGLRNIEKKKKKTGWIEDMTNLKITCRFKIYTTNIKWELSCLFAL